MTEPPDPSPPPDPSAPLADGSTSGEGGVRDLDRVLMALYPAVEIFGSADGGWSAVAEFHPQPEHRGNAGWLQGGLAATVLDHVCARAASAALGERVVTGTLDLRYPRPVALGSGPYRVRAEAGRPRGRVVRVSGAMVDSDDRPMVQAKGLFLVRPEPD